MNPRDPERSRTTREILEAIEAGEEFATDELFPVVYQELRRIARAQMGREPAGHTLQPTALVNEAYLRLLGSETRWKNRAHFFSAASEAMRRLLIERARRVKAERRGGGMRRVELLSGDGALGEAQFTDLLVIDEALEKLAKFDTELERIAKLRTFAGLSIPEISRAMQMTPRTVDRRWRTARAFLMRQLEEA